MDLNYQIIIPIIIIVIAFLTILIIFFRKYSDLLLVDLNTIPEERSKQLKDKLLAERLERRSFYLLSKIFAPIIFIYKWCNICYSALKNKIELWEKSYRLKYRPVIKANDMEEQVKILLEQGYKFLEDDKYDDAEREFLEVISHDKHNINAYKGLGRLYYRQKEYQQAREILDYAVKLCGHTECNLENSDIAQVYYYLALVYQALDNLDKALEYFKNSVDKENNNPKYLNSLLNLAIELKNKDLASETLEKLEEVNPDNLKLPEFKKTIEEMK